MLDDEHSGSKEPRPSLRREVGGVVDVPEIDADEGSPATHEEIALHVELAERRSSPLPPEGLAAIHALETAQAGLPRPADLGRVIAP